ncbi:MAG: hypothetical protein DMF61_04500 [Blastocatellia bacterium AA13]|nr:MAG: hypothetical protein DMF61_04500 [Blastocatellia bacterium AA13]
MTKKILLVEDDFETRYLLSLVLRNEGYEVLTVRDGDAAFAIAVERGFDLIITDVDMPIMNGVVLTSKIRSTPVTASVPVVGITAYGPATIKSMLEAGASVCARKPLNFEDFIPKIRELLT